MNKTSRGFTLIELLIVITILGILSVLGARQFGNAIARANAQADVTNAATLAHAVEHWVLEEDKKPLSFFIGEGYDPDEAESLKFSYTIEKGEENEEGFMDLSPYINKIPNRKVAIAEDMNFWGVAIDADGKVVVKGPVSEEDDVEDVILYPVPVTFPEDSLYAVLN